ncbi:MAG: UDP-2,4-diacetamido-2,4,6-trideoxy-beta-L-altropyranose hydrolase [Candidatus Zixiibacteriota bacterium]
MNVAIRVDASCRIGTGHVMRCLTLAEMLRANGAAVSFICREHPGHLCDLIEQKGHYCHRLPCAKPGIDTANDEYSTWLAVSVEEDTRQTQAFLQRQQCDMAWLIVDHYVLDERWEKAMRPYAEHIMVIDDLADRRHDCDLLLDQNLYEDLHTRYDGLLPENCQKLLGPQYALLRREFVTAREKMPQRNGTVNCILVFFGGADATNETIKALEAIRLLGRPDIAVDVVVGSSNLHKGQIETAARNMPNVTLHHQAENMAELMVRADLAIGGGGTTTWERCYLGLPTITIIVAENQRETIEAVAARGAVWNMGWYADVFVDTVGRHLKYVLDSPEAVRATGQAAREVMGDRNDDVQNPVAAALLEMTGVVRQVLHNQNVRR